MDFIAEWRKSRANILTILILDKIANRLFKHFGLNTGRVFATGILFLGFEVAQLAIMAIVQRPVWPVLGASLIIACITSLCFYSIASAHQYGLELWEAALREASFSKRTETRLVNWLMGWANLRHQLIASIVCVAVILGYALIFDVFFISWDAIVFVSLMALGGGQGFYWGIATPLMTTHLCQSPIAY
ncbi:MAG: hypothetical protein FJ030_08990 [Chloroflexi bacterium]|nr:hypothetical protein [Chloroflexota bacterium]